MNDEKELLITGILNAIIPYVNADDVCQLKNSISIIMHEYNVKKTCTEVAVANKDIFRKAAKAFFIAKKVEGCTDRTLGYYKGRLNEFFESVPGDVGDVTPDVIRYYLAVRSTRDKISKVTQDNELRVLKSFFGWCTANGYIHKNPTLAVKAIKKEKRIKRPFSEMEMELLRQAAGKSKRDLAIVDTLYSTGCRVSELCGMDRDSIDGNEIVVFGKGEKERTVYINAKAQLSIKAYMESRDDTCKALFVTERKPYIRLGKSGIELIVKNIGKLAGVRNCHPHRFRRTMATNALNRGMQLAEVQRLLGHEDIGTTTIYAEYEQSQVKSDHKKYVV